MKTRESTLTKKILQYLNGMPDCKAEKNHGSPFTKRGRPDINLSYRGRHGVIEVKIWPNKPTVSQVKQLKEWEEAGSIALVAYDLTVVKEHFK